MLAISRATPNFALYNLRDARGETQQDLADALHMLAIRHGINVAVTGNQVSRWERGLVRPAAIYRRLLAEHFDVTLAELGLTRPRQLAVQH